MDPIEKLEWSALEYEAKDRSQDWFWALGVIIVTTAITSLIFGNYFFAILIVLGGTLLGFFAHKEPKTIYYEINPKGVKTGNRLFPFEAINSFWVQTETNPTLFIKSERVFMPIISIPIDINMAEHVREIFLFKEIPEEEMREHISDKIMESLGF